MGKPMNDQEELIGQCCLSCANNNIGWFCDETKSSIENPRKQGMNCSKFMPRLIRPTCTQQQLAAICCPR